MSIHIDKETFVEVLDHHTRSRPKRSAGVQAVVVCFLFMYMHVAHPLLPSCHKIVRSLYEYFIVLSININRNQ